MLVNMGGLELQLDLCLALCLELRLELSWGLCSELRPELYPKLRELETFLQLPTSRSFLTLTGLSLRWERTYTAFAVVVSLEVL